MPTFPRAAACLMISAWAASVRALPVVLKVPGGPWVSQSGTDFSVPAGQPIEWSIRLCNDTATPLNGSIQDYLHSGECSGHEQLTLLCPPLTTGNGTLAACDDAVAQPLTQPALDVQSLVIAPNDCIDVLFRTQVALFAPVASQVCNVGVYGTDAGTPDASGQTSPPGGAGCSCVTVLPPVPTQMALSLGSVVEVPPFVAGDAESTVRYDVAGTNLTPRAVVGRFVLPIPTGLTFVETLLCPPGATCSVTPAGEIEIAGLAMAEGAGFDASFRLRGDCGSVASTRVCAQGYFEPLEDPANRILTGDPSSPGPTPTCFKPATADLVLRKTYRLDDRDGSGTATAGDRVRFLITAWNRGVATARDVQLIDSLPIGYVRTGTGPDAVTIDPAGRYSAGTGTWTFNEIGAGTVATAWIEATMQVDAVAPNRARLSTRVLRECGVATVLSDNPLTPPDDPTSVAGAGTPQVVVLKTFALDDADGDGRPSVGESVTYLLVVRNAGTGRATNVTLTDALPACLADLTAPASVAPPTGGADGSTPRVLTVSGVGGPDGLDPGEEVAVSFLSTILDPNPCCNQATATSDGGPVVPSRDPRGLGAPEATCLLSIGRMVRLEKRVTAVDANGDGRVNPGERLVFDVDVANDGVAIPDLLVTDEMPAGFDVDPASVVVTSPSGARPSLALAPAGLHGTGRLQVDPISLQGGERANIHFEGTVTAASGVVCNQASVLATSIELPRLSATDGVEQPACVTIEPPVPPTLAVALTLSGALSTDCALPGEDGDVEVTLQVSGGSTALATRMRASGLDGLDILDADGGVVGPGDVGWDLGDLAPGSVVTKRLRVAAPCDASGTFVVVPDASAANASAVAGGAATFDIVLPVISGALAIDHDDTSADGVLDPGETLLVTVSLTETAGCDAGVVTVRLPLDPALSVVELRDGAVLSGSDVTWAVPVAGGGAASLSVVLALSDPAPSCAQPVIAVAAEWQASVAPCTGIATWSHSVPGPPGPCAPSGMDLLRDDTVSVLDAGTLALVATLLDPAGVEDSCAPGAVTAVDPGMVFATDIGSQLDPGIVIPGDGLPVGDGAAGVLVFYEVSRSCDVIRACRVDDDGDGSNGRESVLVTVRPCP